MKKLPILKIQLWSDRPKLHRGRRDRLLEKREENCFFLSTIDAFSREIYDVLNCTIKEDEKKQKHFWN